MTRLPHLTWIRPLLIAAGVVLSLTSVGQAQLDDGMPTTPFPGTVINLPSDSNPGEDVDVGDATGATLTQLNMNTGVDFATGDRTYSFTEVNVLAANMNPSTSPNSNAIYNNCEINMMTGFLGNNAVIDANSTLNISGGEVRANSTIAGVANVSTGGIGNPRISGIVNLSEEGEIFGGSSSIIDGGVVNSSGGRIFGPFTVRTGGTLNVEAGSDLRNATISGTANFRGGLLNNTYTIEDGGVLNVMEGASPGAATTTINSGGTINLSGGFLGSNTFVQSGGVLNVSGGTIGTAFNNPPGLNVLSGGTVNFTGTDFALDGTPIILTPGMPCIVTDRTGTLTGTLSDGETISFNLSATKGGIFTNFFEAGSTVTVGSVLLGDVNLDGDVDFSDIAPFIAILVGTGFQAEADINLSGTVDFSDIAPFIMILSAPPSP